MSGVGKAILILGESGSGKSTSLRNLNPRETMVFSPLGKMLPIRGSKLSYTVWNKETNNTGNVVITSSAKAIIAWIRHISANMPNVHTIIVDDAAFLSAKELDKRREETTWNRFNDIAHEFLALSEVANTLREDINIYFMYHVSTDGDDILTPKFTKALSHGKMINEKLASIEAQFEIVLLACKMLDNDNKLIYRFKTRDLHSTTKTPMGLFDEEYIDNDLDYVNKMIHCYYNNEDCTTTEEKSKKTKVIAT